MKKIITIALVAVAVAALSACEPVDSSTGTTDDTVATDTDTAADDTEAEAPAEPKYTVAQEQAIQSAEGYVDMSGFSRAGLIGQLSSKAGEGFKKSDAVFAVNHIKVDWNKEAVESAKSYLEMGGFSRAGLIQQLSSSSGEQFTLKQAKYATTKLDSDTDSRFVVAPSRCAPERERPGGGWDDC